MNFINKKIVCFYSSRWNSWILSAGGLLAAEYLYAKGSMSEKERKKIQLN